MNWRDDADLKAHVAAARQARADQTSAGETATSEATAAEGRLVELMAAHDWTVMLPALEPADLEDAVADMRRVTGPVLRKWWRQRTGVD